MLLGQSEGGKPWDKEGWRFTARMLKCWDGEQVMAQLTWWCWVCVGLSVEDPTCLLRSWTALGMLCKPKREGKISVMQAVVLGGLSQCWLHSVPIGKPACCTSVPGLLLLSCWLASLISTATLPSLEVQAGAVPWAVKLLLCCFLYPPEMLSWFLMASWNRMGAPAVGACLTHWVCKGLSEH